MGIVVTDGYKLTGLGPVVDGTNGGMRHFWDDNQRATKLFISRYRLKPIDTTIFGGRHLIRWPIPFPGIPVPHIHMNGSIYQLSTNQWSQYTQNIIKELSAKITKIQDVGLAELDAFSSIAHSALGSGR